MGPIAQKAAAHIKLYTDRLGYITTKDGDGGDSPQRLGMYYFAMFLYGRRPWPALILTKLSRLEVKSGRYIRHPDPDFWGSRTNTMSRDQTVSLVIMMGAYCFQKKLKELFYAHISRLGFYWNTRRNGMWPTLSEHKAKAPAWKKWDYSWKIPDFAPIHHWGVYVRAFRAKWLYPFLIISDLSLLLDAIIRVLKSYVDSKDTLDDNFLMMVVQAKVFMPTPLWPIIAWMYKKRAYPVTDLRMPRTDLSPGQAALEWQFATDHYPPMDQLWFDILAHYDL
jgi:hypothetical protein